MFDAAIKGEILAFANLDKSFKEYSNYGQLSIVFPSYQKINYYSENMPPLLLREEKIYCSLLNRGWLKYQAMKNGLLKTNGVSLIVPITYYV